MGFVPLFFWGMSTLLRSRIAFVASLTTALFYAVPGVLCANSTQSTKAENGSVGSAKSLKASSRGRRLTTGGKPPGTGLANNISQKTPSAAGIAKGAGSGKTRLAQGNVGTGSGLERIQIDRKKPDLNFKVEPPGDGQVKLREPISTEKSDKSSSRPTGDSVAPVKTPSDIGRGQKNAQKPRLARIQG